MAVAKIRRFDEKLRKKFVYVVGSARGGSWLFFETLRLSDEILALPYMTHFANQVWRYRNKVHQRLLNQIFHMPCLEEWQSLDHLDRDTFDWLNAEMNRGLTSKNMALMWRLYPLIHALGPNNPKPLDAIRCWADKANDVSYLKAISRNFPEARFVFVLRDPRATALSLSKRSAQKLAHGDDPGRIAHLCASCLYWRRMVQTMLRFAQRHPKRCFLVKFEDMLDDPVVTLNSIFSFIGVSEHPQEELLGRLENVAYGASNNPSETGRGISRDPLERWQRELSEKDQEIIAALTGPAALKAGYDIPKAGRAKAFKSIVAFPGVKAKLQHLGKFGFLEIHEFFTG